MSLNCLLEKEATVYFNYPTHHYVMMFQAAFCMASLVVNPLFLYKCRKYLYFHNNCKVLIMWLVAINLVHSVFLGGNQIYHLYRIAVATEACDLPMSNLICMAFRFPSTACLPAYSIVHLLIALERLLATASIRHYESSKKLSKFIHCTIIVLSSVVSYYALHNWPPYDQSFYCSSNSPLTFPQFLVMSYGLFILDAISLLLHVFNQRWNVRISHDSRLSFNVQYRYQLKENIDVLRIFTPIMIFHVILHGLFCLCTCLYIYIKPLFSDHAFKAFLSATYTLPVYSFLSPLFIWWILSRNRHVRSCALADISTRKFNEQNVYFNQFHHAW